MQKKLVLAVLSAFAAGSAFAASDTNIKGDSWDAPVVVYPTDDGTGGMAKIGEMDVDVKDGIVLDSVTFKNTNPDHESYRIGYLKHFGKTAVINTLEVEAGTADKPTVGNLEYWGKVKDETGKKFDVKKAVLRDNSALRVSNSTYKSNRYTGTVKESLLNIDQLVMDGTNGVVFGFNKESAAKRTIGTIWVGYSDAEEGKFSEVTGVSGLGGTGDYKSVQVGTVNVGNGTFTNIQEVHEKIPNATKNFLEQLVWSSVKGTTLNSLDGSDTITFNLNHENAKLALGTIGTITPEQATLDDTPTVLPVNLDININVEGYANDITIEKIQTGADVDISTAGSADKSGAEVAKETAGLLKVGDITGAAAGEKGTVRTIVSVGQAGLNDATETVFEVVDDGTNPPALDTDNGTTHVTGTNTVLASLSEVSSLGLMQWRAEMNHMQYRLGEIRDHNGYNNGVWARAYQGKDEYGSQNIENEYFGFQAGYDHRLEGTNVILGAAVNYTQGDSTFDHGEGDNYTLAVTGYGTWLLENGMFLDGTIKYGTLSNDVDMDARDGANWIHDSASYDTNAMSVSIEGGWRFPIAEVAYVEPQVEMMYGHVWSADYGYADYDVTTDAVDMLVGRAGFMAGLKCPNNKGGVYFRGSVLHDFKGDADTEFRYQGERRTLSEDLGGTWYELGIGGNWNVTDATYLYADFQYADGGEVDTPWRWSLGVRHAF